MQGWLMKTSIRILIVILILFVLNLPLSAQGQKREGYFDPTKLPGFDKVMEQAEPFEQLEIEAYVLVKACQYEEAADIYSRLVNIRPYASPLWIMLAHCYNAMGRWQDAYDTADIAIGLDPAYTYYRIERGIAAFRLEKNREAIEDLEAYVGVITQSAQGHFYLGLARIADGDYDGAETSLSRAVSLNPEMEVVAGLVLAGLDAEKGRKQEALTRLNDLSLVFKGMPVEKAIQDRIEDIKSGRTVGKAKNWSLYFSAKTFYDSNVISANDDAVLPTEISSRRDEGFAYDMGGRYRLYDDGRTSILGILEHQGQLYFSLDDYDTLTIRPSLRIDHRLNDWWTGRFRIHYDYTWLDRRSYNNMLGFTPSITHRWGEKRHYTTLGGELKMTDYALGSPPAVDRDGNDCLFFLKHRFLFWQDKAQVGAGLFVGKNRTDGTEYDADYYGFSVDLAVPVVWEILFASTFRYAVYGYNNVSVYSATPTKRDNDVIQVGFSLSRPITKSIQAFFDVSYTDNDSNIQAFEYDRTVYWLGLSFQY